MDTTTTYKLKGHDHTVGNLIVSYLLRDSAVSCAAYKMPHPLARNIEITVLADDPAKAFHAAIDKAVSDLEIIAQKL